MGEPIRFIPKRNTPYDVEKFEQGYPREGQYSGYGGGNIVTSPGVPSGSIPQSFNDVNIERISALNTLERGLIGRTVTITTTPTLIVKAPSPRAYIIVNPSLIVGTTNAGSITGLTAKVANGNTQATSLGVANFGRMHLFLNVTAIASPGSPSLDIYGQTLDPVGGTVWIDTQALFTGVAATGTQYAYIGDLGVATDFAIRWTLTNITSVTFSVGFVLKDGLIGTGTGLNKIVYIGGNSGVTVDAGFPLLEGQMKHFFFKENMELWGVANSSLDLRIFEL